MAHSSKARSHHENRYKICIVCMKKGDYPLSGVIIERIQKYFIENYDINEECMPASICAKCRSDLQRIDAGKKDADSLPAVFDFGLIKPVFEKTTRSNEYFLCDCLICETVRVPGVTTKRKPGPSTEILPRCGKVCKICSVCKSPVARGLSHKCNITMLRKNLINMCTESDDRTQGIVASTLVSEKLNELQGTPQQQSNLKLDTCGPNPLKISVVSSSNSSSSPRTITSKQLSGLQLSLGASNYAMVHKVMPFLRDILGKQSVSSYTDTYFRQRDNELSNLFSIKTETFDNEPKPIVFCNDIALLIQNICSKRDFTDAEDITLKLGLDGGGGFFKVCLTISDSSKETTKHSFLDTSVKRIIILALVPDIKETYGNVCQILNLLQIQSLELKYTYAMDLKLCNIVAGIQSHGCSFPCVYCVCPKIEFSSKNAGCHHLRTLGSIKAEANRYQGCGDAKICESTTNPPLISGDDGEMLISLIPPPELHLLLRTFNKIYGHMEKLTPTCNEICSLWIKAVGISRPKMHSGDFNGNMCRSLLLKIDILRNICETKSCFELMPYCELLKDLNNIRVSCFGNHLHSSFEKHIKDFEQHYISLDISVTTAVHIVTKHIIQFCKLKKCSLGPFSEQASESVHSDFLAMYNSSGKVGSSNLNYGRSLLNAVIRYNGRHIC